MHRIAVVGLSLLSVAGLARADQPLPVAFVGESTMAVAKINLTKLTVSALQDTIRSVVDQPRLDAAGAPLNIDRDIMPNLQQAGMVLGMMGMFTANGADVISIVVNAPAEGMEGEPDIFVMLPARDEGAAQGMSGFAGGMGGQMGLLADTFNDDGRYWVVLHKSGQNMPTEGSANRHAQFTEAIGKVTGANTFSFVMVPTSQMRAEIDEHLDEMDADDPGAVFGRYMKDMRMMAGWFELGKSPVIGLGAQLNDESSASALTSAYGQAMSGLISTLEEQGADADMVGMANRFKSAAAMETQGSTVRIVLDTAELKDLVTTGILSGPAMMEAMQEYMPDMGGMFGG